MRERDKYFLSPLLPPSLPSLLPPFLPSALPSAHRMRHLSSQGLLLLCAAHGCWPSIELYKQHISDGGMCDFLLARLTIITKV